jgi:hypothetical protein
VDSPRPAAGLTRYAVLGPPATEIRAGEALNVLLEAIKTTKVLQDPNAGNHFNKTWTAQGNTVADLVRGMAAKGLKFAPAARGDEAAYIALHHALLLHDFRLHNPGR